MKTYINSNLLEMAKIQIEIRINDSFKRRNLKFLGLQGSNQGQVKMSLIIIGNLKKQFLQRNTIYHHHSSKIMITLKMSMIMTKKKKKKKKSMTREPLLS